MEIAYGADRVAIAQQDRHRRRQLADDFETDLKVVKEAGWQVELETGPAWLTGNNGNKRPIGFWNQLLNARWRFNLPQEALSSLTFRESQHKATSIQKKKSQKQPPPGPVIREARKAKGWSRAFFAATMGKSISWVDAVETGHRNVSEKDLPKLIDKLELRQIILYQVCWNTHNICSGLIANRALANCKNTSKPLAISHQPKRKNQTPVLWAINRT